MPTRTDLDPALARCAEIVHRRPTHLGEAARELADRRRQELFLACYASMRIADDMIDEDFLMLSSVERLAARPRVSGLLGRWLSQAEQAATGSFEPAEGSLEPELFLALSEQLGPTGLDARPWRMLARSLARDLVERPIADWEDFLEYCEGACVAPASVFVYIVAAEFDADGRSSFPVEREPREFALDLAIYSYLVHMGRDLFEDAQRSAQLVLLPRDWLLGCGLTVEEGLARLAAGSVDGLEPALEELAARTISYRGKARASIQRAERELGPEAAASLSQILEKYEAVERRV